MTQSKGGTSFGSGGGEGGAIGDLGIDVADGGMQAGAFLSGVDEGLAAGGEYPVAEGEGGGFNDQGHGDADGEGADDVEPQVRAGGRSNAEPSLGVDGSPDFHRHMPEVNAVGVGADESEEPQR